MTKKINTAQALLAHISLKTKALPLFDTELFVKQWTASQRVKYMELLQAVPPDSDELAQIKAQALIVALSLVNDNGDPLFDHHMVDGEPQFADPSCVDTLLENSPEKTSQAFVEIAAFNGVYCGANDSESEDENVKN